MSAEHAEALTPLQDLSARLVPGALCFALASAGEAEVLRAELPRIGRAWVGWRMRESLLRAWRPAPQERYHSVAGRDAPTVRVWLEDAFKIWKESERGDAHPWVDGARLDAALRLCGLAGLAGQPMSLLSNGEAARACLAAALGSRPTLLVLDDLTEGLDAAGRLLLRRAAEQLAREGAAVLVLASRPSLLPGYVSPAPLINAKGKTSPTDVEVFSCCGLLLEAGVRALVRGLDWRLCAGEVWHLSGPNGAGKSTLLAYLSGEHPQAWAQSWSLLGRDRFAWTPPERLRREVAWVSPELAAASGLPLQAMVDQALSGSASLVILDEALRGLNADTLRRRKTDLSLSFQRNQGRCVVFVSHDPSELPEGITRSLVLPGDGSWVLDPSSI